MVTEFYYEEFFEAASTLEEVVYWMYQADDKDENGRKVP